MSEKMRRMTLAEIEAAEEAELRLLGGGGEHRIDDGPAPVAVQTVPVAEASLGPTDPERTITGGMNLKQTIAMWVGVILSLAALMYPPIVIASSGDAPESGPNRWIWNEGAGSIDLLRIGAEFVAIWMVVGAVMVTCKSRSVSANTK